MKTSPKQPYSPDHYSHPNGTSPPNVAHSSNHQNRTHAQPHSFEPLPPPELNELSDSILLEIEKNPLARHDILTIVPMMERFKARWEKAFSKFGHHSTGELAYQDIILYFSEQIVPRVRRWLPEDGEGKHAVDVIRSMSWTSASTPKRFGMHLLEKKRARDRKRANPVPVRVPEFDRPLFIVCTPRAGSTLLFNALSNFPELWSTGDENHELVENIEGLHPRAHDFHSNRLREVDATPDISAVLQKQFTQELQDRDRRVYLELPAEQRPGKVRFLEKTPKNALRIPFFKAMFPGALFIYLYRDPAENISSMMEGWRSRRFVSYRNLPGWPFKEWSFLLVPEWLSLQDSSLAEIAAYQWKATNSCIVEDLRTLPESAWCRVDYSDLVGKTQETIGRISEFAGLHWDRRIERILSEPLPISERTLSAPSPGKWRKNEKEISAVLSKMGPISND
uniref:Sulfotransferase family protein n=1 Tax=Candidatus Kentrum sp. FM TaxID=2126340 RepID=A0A450TXP4_9GAMM|nr:MAG: Sulfotransferase family protein [Candidatus Kentron sp. FM]VFJ74175.1 MAG: Sulfotransferase family protein [Candidatus Kentron sp. FM]VFK05804.1 MAG: Sulfotransferase family protein [Candidatus Kentron sp. FM]